MPVYPGMLFDEEYGSRFARALDLASFDTRLESFDGEPGLVIERYDRVGLSRVHQDFSQVLGLIGDAKYEKFEGRPLRDVAKLLQPRDRVRLFRQLALSVAVGNLDFHAKNISLLHDENGGFQLAQTEVPHPAAHPDLAHIIGRIARNLVEGRAAGDDGAGLTTASGSVPSGAL